MLIFLILCTIFCPILPLCPILLCPILQFCSILETLQFMFDAHRSNLSFRDTLQISFLILSEFKRVIIRFLLTSRVNGSSLIRSILEKRNLKMIPYLNAFRYSAAESHLKPSHLTKTELFGKVFDGRKPLTSFTQSSILDISLGPEYALMMMKWQIASL